MIKNKNFYKDKCECGDYKPYEPVGFTSMLFPLYACTGCYHEVMMKELGLDSIVFSTNLKTLENTDE